MSHLLRLYSQLTLFQFTGILSLPVTIFSNVSICLCPKRSQFLIALAGSRDSDEDICNFITSQISPSIHHKFSRTSQAEHAQLLFYTTTPQAHLSQIRKTTIAILIEESLKRVAGIRSLSR